MYQQVISNLFKNYTQTNLLVIIYVYSFLCKQMRDVKLLLLHSNTWNHLTSCYKKIAQARLKILSTKYFYKP